MTNLASAHLVYHKVCQEQHCHKDFDTANPRQLFCSPTCETNAKWSAQAKTSWSRLDARAPRPGDLDAAGWWSNAVRNMEA